MNPAGSEARPDERHESGIKEKEIRWLVEEKYGGIKTAEAELDIERLRAGEHISYVIGFIEFLGSKIDLSSKPLIPRPETEFWVGEAIKELKDKDGDLRVLDVFSGSGCVGISLLRHISNSRVEFLEKDSRLLAQIRKNLEGNSIAPERATILHSDVFSAASGTYDAILANPPYVDAGLSEYEKEQLSHEPPEALYAPDRGFFYVKKVLTESPLLLKRGGMLYCEIGEGQGDRVMEFQTSYRKLEIRRDQYEKPRYIYGVT